MPNRPTISYQGVSSSLATGRQRSADLSFFTCISDYRFIVSSERRFTHPLEYVSENTFMYWHGRRLTRLYRSDAGGMRLKPVAVSTPAMSYPGTWEPALTEGRKLRVSRTSLEQPA